MAWEPHLPIARGANGAGPGAGAGAGGAGAGTVRGVSPALAAPVQRPVNLGPGAGVGAASAGAGAAGTGAGTGGAGTSAGVTATGAEAAAAIAAAAAACAAASAARARSRSARRRSAFSIFCSQNFNLFASTAVAYSHTQTHKLTNKAQTLVSKSDTHTLRCKLGEQAIPDDGLECTGVLLKRQQRRTRSGDVRLVDLLPVAEQVQPALEVLHVGDYRVLRSKQRREQNRCVKERT
jgi:hypothetical protein